MSGSGGEGRSGYRRQGRWHRPPLADINVTPLVDVMLVLLIIFMVAAPLLVTGVPVDLPDAQAQSLAEDDTPIQVSIDAEGLIFIDELEVPRAALPEKLRALAEVRTDEGARVYVRADAGLDYGQVMDVVGVVNAAGFSRVALLTQLKSGPGAP